MIQFPAFKSHFYVEPLQPDKVFLVSEQEQHVLTGSTYHAIAPLLDGTKTVAEITQQVDGELTFLDVFQAVTRLQVKGLLADAESDVPTSIVQLCDLLRIDSAEAYTRLQNTRLFIHALGDIDVQPFTQRLHDNHVNIVTSPADADLYVVVTSHYAQPELERLNTQFLESGERWMLVQPFGTLAKVGPVFEPKQSGCWKCLEKRLLLHRRTEVFLQNARGTENETLIIPPTESLPLFQDMGLSWSTIEILKLILEDKFESFGEQIVTFNVHLNEAKERPVTRRPQCPTCGDTTIVPRRTQQPVVLHSQRKKFTKDGGHRTVKPDDTVARLEKHVDNVTGLISWMQKAVKDDPTGVINTYYTAPILALHASDYFNYRHIAKTIAAGKGVSDQQSKASAICEAIERYSACRQGDELHITASYNELGAQAIHPYVMMNFSQRQYEMRSNWDRKDTTHRPPIPFRDDAQVQWTPVWSFTEQKHKYVPTDYCYFTNGSFTTPADSNGNAAGNTIEEAVLQGLMELIERDAIGIWWYNEVDMPGVDLHSFDLPYIQRYLDCYASYNRDVWVVDVTNDLGIPVFAAISRRNDQAREDIIYAFGCHLDPKVAMLRAITELNQGMASFANMKDDKLPAFNEICEQWWNNAKAGDLPYLCPSTTQPPRTASDYTNQSSDDIKTDIELVIARLADVGIEVLVLDQSQPDVELNVVKVFAPGLRHDYPRFAPGRLYDVPVKMGWAESPRTELTLNQHDIYF